jgi:hypothetical protein
MTRVQPPPVGINFSLYCGIQIGSGADLTIYPVDTGGSFPWGKVIRVHSLAETRDFFL